MPHAVKKRNSAVSWPLPQAGPPHREGNSAARPIARSTRMYCGAATTHLLRLRLRDRSRLRLRPSPGPRLGGAPCELADAALELLQPLQPLGADDEVRLVVGVLVFTDVVGDVAESELLVQHGGGLLFLRQIGRASCRERV